MEKVQIDPGLEGCAGENECCCKVAFLRTLLNVYRLESKEREKTTELQRFEKKLLANVQHIEEVLCK